MGYGGGGTGAYRESRRSCCECGLMRWYWFESDGSIEYSVVGVICRTLAWRKLLPGNFRSMIEYPSFPIDHTVSQQDETIAVESRQLIGGGRREDLMVVGILGSQIVPSTVSCNVRDSEPVDLVVIPLNPCTSALQYAHSTLSGHELEIFGCYPW